MHGVLENLIVFLRQEQEKGVTHVSLDEGARHVLREWSTRKLSKPQIREMGVAKRPVADDNLLRESRENLPDQPVREMTLTIEGNSKAERIASLQRQAQNCPAAKALGTLRNVMVFSVGNPEARIVFVGEAPGSEEERKKEPFVGPAGQKLDGILKAMGLTRSEVYITNVSKFRPAMPQQTTNNRPPTAKEMAVGMNYVRREIEVIQPECIVALGGSAANGLLGLDQVPVGELRGKWHEFTGIPVRVTFHPSYLLRTQSSNTEKRKLWEDMLEVMGKMAMPISEKQRGYFL